MVPKYAGCVLCNISAEAEEIVEHFAYNTI